MCSMYAESALLWDHPLPLHCSFMPTVTTWTYYYNSFLSLKTFKIKDVHVKSSKRVWQEKTPLNCSFFIPLISILQSIACKVPSSVKSKAIKCHNNKCIFALSPVNLYLLFPLLLFYTEIDIFDNVDMLFYYKELITIRIIGCCCSKFSNCFFINVNVRIIFRDYCFLRY